jgi:hypothetical protein
MKHLGDFEMPTHKTDTDRLFDANEIIRKKNTELNDHKRTIEALRRADDTAESIRNEIFGLAEHSPAPPKWLTGKGVKAGARGGPMVMLSDLHYGEVVNPDEVGGVNKFNMQIAAERIKRFTNTTIDLCFNHMGRANVAYPGIVMCLGGDLIGGDIHEELLATNDRTPHQSVNDLTDLLAGSIEQFASKFGRVFVPSVVGNHGRSTHKPRMKGRVFTNYDWVIACNLERAFRHDKRIQFYTSNEADAHFTVFGHRFMLTHGDSLGTKGGDGIIGALGPIMRGTLKTGRNAAQIGRDFDTLVIGHWHQYITLPGLICNNSLKGYDEYAMLQLRAPYSRPSQALWFVHPEHGVTAHWQVYLEGLKKADQDKEWLKWR